MQQLKERLAEIADLQGAVAVLEWDQQTYMPPGGAAGRAEQMATLHKLAHEKFIAPEIGALLADLQDWATTADPEADDTCLVIRVSRDYARACKVPAELVAEIARTTGIAHSIWAQARAAKDFSLFRPLLEKIFALRRQEAMCFAPPASLYDPLLDDYEPALQTPQLQAIFNHLKANLIPLAQAIIARPAPDDAFIYYHYGEKAQWQWGIELIRQLGYDFKRGRQDLAVHPFTTALSLGDIRITTRIYPHCLTSALMSTLHECGHALYDQGISPTLARTPLAAGASLGIHESQSRLWENIVGRSWHFWSYFYPKLQKTFPHNLGTVSLDSFYAAINKVQPSLIRVEADEITYNLHILLRFELEVDVLEGRLEVADLPAAWNTKVKEYLGLEVPDDSQGVLQDVHWSDGYIGYFPTYTLGNIIAAQLYTCAIQEQPTILEDIARGEFGHLLHWLRRKIHCHGRKYLPQDLIQRATGQPLDVAPYLAYLRQKYTDLYHL